MEWLSVLILLVLLYTLISVYVVLHNRAYQRQLLKSETTQDDRADEKEPGEETGDWIYDHISFFGPIMAIRTHKVGIFDFFAKFSLFFRIYGTLGVLMVILVSIFFTISLFLSLRYTLTYKPTPTGIYEPQNLLLIPGVNQYVPGTVAVWLALVLTLAIHEFGHGILARVEHMRVRSAGLLLAVIPIGAFVEPDEQDVAAAKGMPKIRMFGAGITNNLVFGLACIFLMITLFGMAAPTTSPVIYGIYQDYPAHQAGVPQDSIVTAINGTPLSTREQVALFLNGTRPGDPITLEVQKDGIVSTYPMTLAMKPGTNSTDGPGFMGVIYYDAPGLVTAVKGSFTPIGLLKYLVLPFDQSEEGQFLRVLGFETTDTQYYSAPFPGFWGLIHLLFWSGWISINVGIFNALPMVPLDGGYIMQEGIQRISARFKLERFASSLAAGISALVMTTMVALIALPYLLHL
ncbi:site-2 protease family protein [Methanosphaerula palustris]|uniref:Peptidase M50 n=1 Tax=Methanosphaerula palustris (strain ATCC BAA-1556 / DSM 19958 / E1-9c) TaxID=521011 RepID=B8GGR1_METPE|nr:site-2 protease family protein [Methanosphaerula palustris]ACL16316.1 peptidase M50 [Methanosphaerula palustris E1-9c]